jgi:hypothetical protein
MAYRYLDDSMLGIAFWYSTKRIQVDLSFLKTARARFSLNGWLVRAAGSRL